MRRGSRKHIFDWTEGPKFYSQFLDLIHVSECIASHRPYWQPVGKGAPEEVRLELHGARFIPEADCWQKLADWWLVHRRGANTPNWDLAACCTVNSRSGLVLVEAKAHDKEFDWGRKRLSVRASRRSLENHNRIGDAIAPASAALAKDTPAVSLSRDSHYQLANRIAFSWKLGSLGIPTVLVYLGFVGASDVADLGNPLQSDAHSLEITHEAIHLGGGPASLPRSTDPMWSCGYVDDHSIPLGSEWQS
jgi:hypothetical protein